MQPVLMLILTFLALISTTYCQLGMQPQSRNPTVNVKDFAERLKRSLSQEQCILENVSVKKALLDTLEKRVVIDSARRNLSDCDVSLRVFLADIFAKKRYTIRMLDSWGKLESGIATGNIQWLGRYYECINVHASKFSGKYFYLMLGGSVAGYGVCLPSSCTTEDAENIAYPFLDLLNIPFEVYHPVQPTEYTVADILGIIFTSLLALMVIAGTAYEIYLTQKEPLDGEYNQFGNYSGITQKLSVFPKLIISFSIIKNTRAIFSTNQKEGSITVLHGLRFFSMTWVMLGHTFEFGTSFVDNGVDAARVFITDWSFQAVGNATFSVDSFFFLSGLLAAYLALKEMKKRNGKVNVLQMYAYRYLRLTPAYAFCILIVTGILSKFGDGPSWPRIANLFREPCLKYWWTNLLYINNVYPISLSDECFGWGWYLANDMQFFLLLPPLLYLMYKQPIVGAVVLNFIVLLCMVVSGVLSSHYEQQPGPIIIGLYLYNAIQVTSFEPDSIISMSEYSSEPAAIYSQNVTTPIPTPSGPSKSDIFWSDTYAKPWCRMDAYFIGVLAGLILYSFNNRVPMNRKAAIVGWIVAFATALSLVYGLFGSVKNGNTLPNGTAAFYASVSRPIWAFCLMWIVLASSAGYGGPIDAFLSWKAFIPLSRLTYCAYLIHPVVIFYFYGIMETKLHFSITMISFIFAGITFVSFAIAYVLSVLIEMPAMGITRTILIKTGEHKPASMKITEQSKL